MCGGQPLTSTLVYIAEKLKVGHFSHEDVANELFLSLQKLLNLKTCNGGLHMISVIYCAHCMDFIRMET
jgi:hypothetical protein